MKKEQIERRLTPDDRRRLFAALGFRINGQGGEGWVSGLLGPPELGEGEKGDFSVNLSTGAVKDHGSSRYTGDLYKAVQDVLRMDFPQALGWIAEQIGAGNPAPSGGDGAAGRAARPPKRRAARPEPPSGKMQLVSKPEGAPRELAEQWCSALLDGEKGAHRRGREYLTGRRGIDADLLRARRVGLRFDKRIWWIVFPLVVEGERVTLRKERGFDPAGMDWKRDDGGKPFMRTKPSGVGARLVVIADDDTGGPTLLCAGETDAFSARSGGWNVAFGSAGEGTFKQPWAEQVAKLEIAGRGLVVAYDGDDAGQKGAAKAAQPLAEAGLSVRIATLPDGKDVNDVLREGGREALEAIVDAATPYELEVEAAGENAAADMGEDAADEEDFLFPLTQMGNGERLAGEHGSDLRYCHLWGAWLVWDGTCWVKDNAGLVMRYAKATVRGIKDEAEEVEGNEQRQRLLKHARRSESGSYVREMLSFAQAEEDIPVLPSELDQSQWLLNVQNGTLDLRSGALREHQRADLITKTAPVSYDPEAECPRWTQFLREVFDRDEELIQYVQRAAGYTVTGSTEEQCIFIPYGTGANGKGTFINTLAHVAGDYAQATRPELLLRRSRSGGPSEGEAALRGARFVSTSETGRGQKFDEATVKRLTGSDTIRARFMRENEFEFVPTHKLWLATNHKPVIEDTDHAIWRRIHLIPFGVRFDKEARDEQLEEKLKAEASGILNWLVEGCLDWQREGLPLAPAVRRATDQYRSEMDVLAAFLENRCTTGVQEMSVKASRLHTAYKKWCLETGETFEGQRGFGLRMTERGFEKKRRSDGNYYLGIGLRSNRSDDDEDSPF